MAKKIIITGANQYVVGPTLGNIITAQMLKLEFKALKYQTNNSPPTYLVSQAGNTAGTREFGIAADGTLDFYWGGTYNNNLLTAAEVITHFGSSLILCDSLTIEFDITASTYAIYKDGNVTPIKTDSFTKGTSRISGMPFRLFARGATDALDTSGSFTASVGTECGDFTAWIDTGAGYVKTVELISDGAGNTWENTVGEDATLINFPTDDTQWGEYGLLTKPLITVTPTAATIEVGDAYTPPTVTAVDLDNTTDISAFIVTAGDTPDNDTIDTYVVTYNVESQSNAGVFADEKTFTLAVTEPDLVIIVHGVADSIEYDSCTVESYTSTANSVTITNFTQDVLVGGVHQFNSYFYMSQVPIGTPVEIAHLISPLWNTGVALSHAFVYSYDCVTWNPMSSFATVGSTLVHTQTFTQSTVYIARVPTIPMWRWAEIVADWKTHAFTRPSDASDVNFIAGTTTERTSVNGRVAPPLPLYEFIIEDTSVSPVSRDRKLVFHISAGTHPTETTGYLQLVEQVNWLLNSTDAEAVRLRRECIFIVHPALLPAALYCGYYRSDVPATADAGGANDCTPYNSNRYWGDGLAGTIPIPTVLQWLTIFDSTYGGNWDISLDNHTTPQATEKSVYLDDTDSIAGTATVLEAAIDNFSNYEVTAYDTSGGDGVAIHNAGWLRNATLSATPEYTVQQASNPALVNDFAIATMSGISKMIDDGWFDANLRWDGGSYFPDNDIPVANAGVNQTDVAAGATVTLDFSGSTDGDGTITTYTVTQTAGDTVTLSGSGASRTFTAPTTGSAQTLTFSLVVTDDDGADSTPDTVDIGVLAEVIADTTAPVIALTGASTINLDVGDTYTELGATATDNIDGDITADIVITGAVDTATAGTYTKYYNVSDAAENAATQVTRSIIVSAVVLPSPTITIDSLPSVTVGDTGTATATTTNTTSIAWSSTGGLTVNASTGAYTAVSEGAFTLNATATGDGGSTDATEVSGIIAAVVIPDTTKPVIVLSPATLTYNLTVGDTFTLPAATLTDNVDSTISINPVSNNVNTALAGSYSVVYSSYQDVAGNVADSVTITVNVFEENGLSNEIASTLFSVNQKKYAAFKGRNNIETLKFKPTEATESITVDADGYFDFDNNEVTKVEFILGEDSIDTDSTFLSFDGSELNIETGALDIYPSEYSASVIVYTGSDTKGTVICGPGLTANCVVIYR